MPRSMVHKNQFDDVYDFHFHNIYYIIIIIFRIQRAKELSLNDFLWWGKKVKISQHFFCNSIAISFAYFFRFSLSFFKSTELEKC